MNTIFSSWRRFPIIIFLIVITEAFWVLVLIGQGRAGILGGDGLGYHQLASNLLDHFAFGLTGPTIYRCPGYSMFVALIYLVSGHSIIAVKIAQFALLGLTAYWLYLLAMHYVDDRAAKLSALLCATYPPLVFLTTFHLTEVLATCVTVGLILLLVKHVKSDDGNYVISFSIGLTSGILTLIRPSLSLSIFIILAVIAVTRIGGLRKSDGLQKRGIDVALVALGFMLVVSPWLIRNAMLSHKLVLSSANGESLYFSMLQYSGRISYAFTAENWQQVYFPEFRRRNAEVESQLNSVSADLSASQPAIPFSIQRELLLNENWRRGAVEEFQKLSANQIIKSIPQRIAYLWSTCDMAPLSLMAGYFHRFAQAHFILLFLLAVSGILLLRRKLSNEWPLWIFPTYITVVHLFFHIEPRYSMPARPFILIYSAIGFLWMLDTIRKRMGTMKQ